MTPPRLVKVLFVNNFLEYLRDFTSSFFTFVFPLIFVVVFFLTGSNGGGGDLPLVVKGDWRNPQVQSVLTALRQVPTLDLRPANHRGAATLEVLPPVGRVAGSGGPVLRVTADPSLEPVIRTTVLAALGAGVTAPAFTMRFVPEQAKSTLVLLLPAFFGMALLQLGLFGTAAPLLQQRSRGVFRHMRTLPISSGEIVVSLLGTRLAVAAMQMVGLYAIATGLFGFEIEGSLPLFVLLLTLGTLCFVAMGFAIGGVVGNLQLGNLINLALNFLMLGLGNVFFVLPQGTWLAMIGSVLPITVLTDALRQAATGGGGGLSPTAAIVVLSGFTVVFAGLAFGLFRFDMERVR